jgi:hypothetical protein
MNRATTDAAFSLEGYMSAALTHRWVKMLAT